MSDEGCDRSKMVCRRLSGRRILITGAASGIGKATAEACLREGARLILLDRDSDGLADCIASVDAWRGVVDLTDASALRQAVSDGAAAIGGLDGVVNCAGVTAVAPVETMPLDLWNRVIQINLTAPFLVCQAALPFLRRHPEASIVNVASGQGLLPDTPGASAYAASKGGLIVFSKALAAELAPGVRVNVICPGVVRTPMTASYLKDGNVDMVARYALKRAGTADELARSIVFLLSSDSSFTTGAALAVDGGRAFH